MKPADNLLARAELVLAEKAGALAAEVVEKRTLTSKTFRLGPREFHISKRGKPIHYLEDGSFKEIDLGVDANFRVEKAPYKLRLLAAGKVGYHYISRANGGWMEMELVSLDGQPVGKVQRRRDGDKVRWTISPDVSMYLQAKPTHPEIFKVYGSAPHTTAWKITASDDFPGQFNPSTRGKDSAGDNLEILTEYIAGIFTETWTGRVSRIPEGERRRRMKQWSSDPVFPALVDAAITENIEAGADDGMLIVSQGQPEILSTAGTLVACGTSAWTTGGARDYSGLRFQTLAIPAGATIVSATLTLNITENVGFGAGPNIKIFGNDVDDAPAWHLTLNPPNDISKTTAFANLAANTPRQLGKQIDVTTVVAEIVARAGWVTGNDLALVMFPPYAGEALGTETRTSILRFEAFDCTNGGTGSDDGTGVDEAQLDITYTEGEPEPAEPVYPPVAGSVPLRQAGHGLVSEEFQLAHLASRLAGGGFPAGPVNIEVSLQEIRALYLQLDVRPSRGRQLVYADLIRILTGEQVRPLSSFEHMLAILHRSLDAYDAQ